MLFKSIGHAEQNFAINVHYVANFEICEMNAEHEAQIQQKLVKVYLPH